MTTDEILKQSEELWQSLLRTIEKKERENLPPVTRYQHLLMEADQAISILKGMVAYHTFDATAQEVYFFKILKPRFSAKFILYSKILALITTRPHGSYKALRRICDDELDYLHYFFSDQREFVAYYKRGATYLDDKYFLRRRYDLYTTLETDLHSFDSRFATSHDHVAARILAFEEYEAFLRQWLAKHSKNRQQEDSFAGMVTWSASKAALIELLFSLHLTGCFNGGNIELAEVIRWAEASLHTDLGNYHKTLAEVRNRKTRRTKFLDLILRNFQDYLDRSDQ